MKQPTPLISRRRFIAGSAALATSALLAERGWADAQPFFGPDGLDVDGLEQNGYRVRHTICHQCGAGCGLTALIKVGQPISEESMLILPNQHPEHPQRGMCGRGATAPYTWNSPLRLRKPLKRIGARGEGRFEEVSWDQALDEIAAKLREIVDRDSAKSLCVTTHDFGTEATWLTFALNAPNMIGQASTCNTAGIVGRRWMIGSNFSHHSIIDPDYDHVRYIVFPGRSLAAPIGAVHRLNKAREHGAKVVYLNPAHPDLAYAASEWISCTPGSDAAFLLGVAQVLVSEGRIDRPFLQQWTNLPFLIKEDGKPLTDADLRDGGDANTFVIIDAASGQTALHTAEGVERQLEYRGRIALANGRTVPVTSAFELFKAHLEDYTPEKAAAIVGTTAQTITRIARELATARGVVEDTWYNTRNGNDTDAIMAILTVNALLGNIDQPGGLCIRPGARVPGIISRASDGTVSTALGDSFVMTDTRRIDQELYPETNGTFEAVVRGVLEEDPYPIKALILLGATLFHRDTNVQRLEAMLQKLELVVNVDIVHQEVSDWSDYVLPAEMFIERGRLGSVSWTMTGAAMKADKVTDPPPGCEARPNDWIMLEILRRAYPERAAMVGYMPWMADPEVFEAEFTHKIEDARIAGFARNWERDEAEVRAEFREKGFVTVVPQRYGVVPYRNRFDTPSGLLEVYALRPVLRGYRSHGFASYFEPTAYTLPRGENEFFIVSGKSPGGSSGVAGLAFPTQFLVDNALWMNPLDAERLGIADGDTAEVTGLDTGWVARSEIRVTPRVHPGVTFVYSYTGGHRQPKVKNDPRFAKLSEGLNIHWFTRSSIDPVTGANANNASVRIRRA